MSIPTAFGRAIRISGTRARPSDRVTGGATRSVGGQTWLPERSPLHAVPYPGAGRSLGLETAQLNGNHTYPRRPHGEPDHDAE